MKETYKKVGTAIREADALLIGASNGLSISEGYNIFADDQWFQENFGDLRSKYGIRCVLQGLFFKYPSEVEKWTFFSRLISRKCYLEKPHAVMMDLRSLVGSKDYYVVTTNGEDHFVPAGFDKNKVFYMEGCLTQSRCQNGCGAMTYDNREEIMRMAKAEQNGLIPEELVPRCLNCGGPVTVDMADDAAEPGTTYITFNKGEIYIPKEIESRSIGVEGDIAEIIGEICRVS